MTTNIRTPQTILTAQATCVTANTDLDDSPGAGLQPLLTAGAYGGVLYGLTAIPRATVAATRLGLFSSTDLGVTKRLIRSARMAAHTVATDTQIPSTDFGFTETTPRRLKPGEILYVDIGVSVAGGIVFDAQYEELGVP